MNIRSPALFAAMLAFFSGGVASAQLAGQHGVFKVSMTIPVQRVDTGGQVDKVVTKTLGTKDIINLFLGRALGSKVDAKHEVLAVDVTFEDETGVNPPKSRLVIYDPEEGGKDGVNHVVAVGTEIKFVTAFAGATTKGIGVGKATFNPTPAGNGDPSKNAILQGEVSVAGGGAGPHIFNKQENTTTASSGIFTGTFKFRFTDKQGVTADWEGFVLKGSARVTGKQIGNYLEP